MRLRNKFILHYAGLIVVIMTAVMAVVVSRQTSVLTEQARKRAVALARNVAASVLDSLMMFHSVEMEGDAAELAAQEDIAFVSFFDREGRRWAYASELDIPPEAIEAPTPGEEPATLEPRCEERRDVAGGHHILDVRCPVVYVPPLGAGEPEWMGTVRLGLSLEPIDAEIAATQGRLAALWGIALALGLVSSLFLARRVTRPIERVAHGAIRYAGGELEHRITVRGKDEISSLAGNLNDMATQIHANLGEIEELNRSLEAKVRRRTRDLAQTNRELKQAMRRLKETQAQLVQSEKMASLGQLVAGVAHEINNPLNFISNGVVPLERSIEDLRELLELFEQGAIPEPDRERIEEFKEEIEFEDTVATLGSLLDTIREGARRATIIVRDLRNFSRLDEADSKVADLHEGLEGTLNLLRPRLGDRIRVVRDYGEVPEFEFCPAQINQVFMNLLSNAEQAIEREGTITIQTRLVGGEVRIEITDTGCGIPPEHESRIFEPFFTTKDVGEGTGLGLAISYGIVKQHDGSIEVRSTPGEGSSFAVRLPLPTPSPEPAGKSSPAEPELAKCQEARER